MVHLYPSLIEPSTEFFPWNKTNKTPTFIGNPPRVTILIMLETIRTSKDGIVDEVSRNIVSELSNRGIFCGFGEEMMQSLIEGICNKLEYTLNYSLQSAGQLEEFYNSKVMKSVLNGRTFKYNFGGGRFHILLQSHKISHVLFWMISFKLG